MTYDGNSTDDPRRPHGRSPVQSMIHTQTHSLLYTHTWQCVARVQADGAEVCYWNVPLHFFFYVHFFPFLLRT